MIIETDENVFGCNADAIVNTVNCDGFMGKGLALEFALRYPELESAYIEDCKQHRVITGKVNTYRVGGKTIINFPTKYHFKYPSQIVWIDQGLDDFLNLYPSLGIRSVAFPLLGASNGGLDADAVLALMKEKLSKAELDVYICHSKRPDELGRRMVEGFNSTPVEEIGRFVRLNADQRLSLESGKGHIVFFHDIARLPKIGTTTYRALFAFFKSGRGEGSYVEQLKLF